uniref:Uncharacterized protein n=1 Tax=Anguilla anguilla TaxID=7936 RepID=A0A0E9UNX6_ANGAN
MCPSNNAIRSLLCVATKW